MPDVRGSAAKAELCVRSLAQARGMDLPPFKQSVVPGLEAMTRSREDFVGRYAESFSRKRDLGRSFIAPARAGLDEAAAMGPRFLTGTCGPVVPRRERPCEAAPP